MNDTSLIENNSVDCNEINSIPLKRTRAKRSCDFCRKRKARCDADHTVPCSNCRAWGFKCEFLTVRKKRGPPSLYVENLENRCKKMEGLLMRLTNKTIQEIEEMDFNIEQYTSDSDDVSTIEEEEIVDKDIESMEQAIANLSTDDYDSIKYTGISAGIQLHHNDLFNSKSYIQCPGRQDVAFKMMAQKELLLVQANANSLSGKYTRLDVGFSLTSTIFDTKALQQIQPKSIDTCTPLSSTVKKACDLYFTYIHKFLPIVNKSRFDPHDLNNILVQSVLAVSFRFSSRHFPKHFKKSVEYADLYFKKVMKRLQDANRARLCFVQASILMTLYMDMDETDVESLQWFMLGKAIRMAQDIGLHRSCSHWNLPPSEIETRHRVFFACYILDRFMGARAGKPLTILDRDFDTDFPVPYEVHDNTSSNTFHSVYHSFIALIKLSELLGRILKALYAPNSKHSNLNANLDDPTILAVFDRRLKNWKQSSLNEFVSQAERGNPSSTLHPPNLLLLVNLLLFYYTVMLLLHRPFIESSSASHLLAQESRQACEIAACNVMAIVKQKQSFMTDPDSYAPFCLPTYFVYSMFQSSLIHLSLVLQNRDSLLRLKRLQSSILLLKSHQDQLASAQRAHHIVTTLMNVHKIQINTLITSNSNDFDHFHLLDDSTLSLPDNSTPTIQNDMPKSTYYQRMMNTSIIGGITPDLHSHSTHLLGQLLPESRPPLPIFHQDYHKNHNPIDPPSHIATSTTPSPTTTTTTTTNNNNSNLSIATPTTDTTDTTSITTTTITTKTSPHHHPLPPLLTTSTTTTPVSTCNISSTIPAHLNHHHHPQHTHQHHQNHHPSNMQVMNDSYPTVFSHLHRTNPSLYQSPFSTYDLNYTPVTSCESQLNFAPSLSPTHINWNGWHEPMSEFHDQRTFLQQHPS